MADFVHLHLHTQYSLLDGAIRFDRLFDLAKQYRMKACSITDHGNMFGAVDFYFTAQEAGIKPIIGCEAYLAPKSRFDQKRTKGEDNAYHIVLLAMNQEGYGNLLKLTSLGHLEGFYYVPRIDKELLRSHSSGLICLTACIKGEIPNLILKDDERSLGKTIEEYREMFGERLFFELQDNGLVEQKKINERLIDLSKHYGIPIVATNDCHYLKKEDARAHELLLCIQTGKTINDKTRMSFSTDQFYFKSPEELELAFSRYPEALSNTVKIAEMCNLTIETGTYHFPEFTPPGSLGLNEYFEKLCTEGFNKKMEQIHSPHRTPGENSLEKYRQRFLYELEVIKKTGFAGYFLIVSDFINYAKENGIPVGPGRGSAAGSLIAYCLGITDIDPIKYDLIFERFLNPERISMPDIDVDFCKKGRDDVIRYVTDKYGKDNVAQIITFGTMQSKAAVRDVGRALGMPYAEVDKIAKLIVSTDSGIEKAIREEPQIKELYQKDDRVKELLDNAMVLEGLARHASTHAAGIVISNKHLTEYLPLYRGQHDETVTQYDMRIIEKIGLIKIDFLGLETLTLIDSVIKLLHAENIDIDINTIPLDDLKTYELLSSGNTAGVFQLESRGMRDLLVKLKPTKFDDIMPLIALYRPGPLKSGMVDEFIRRKNNPAYIKYETPELEGILQDTHGVIIYQEQIMKIASKLAGFSLKDSDALRKAISKKIPEALEKYKEQFIQGAISNGVSSKAAERIYDIILRFGEYGFNKSHSTAYGLIAYQTAYLKAHYPIHYFAAMLTNEINDTDKLIKYITECRESGIEVLPPDINKSGKAFQIVDNKIRFGLSGIKNVGDAAIDNILQVRDQVGEFNSFAHFCSVADSRKANKKVMESFAKAGCFDSLGLKRSQILYLVNEKTGSLSKKGTNSSYVQMDIFGAATEPDTFFKIPEIEELSHDEILSGEKESMGFYFSQHPLKPYEELIKRLTQADSQNLKDIETSDDVRIVGIVSASKEIVTKRGDKMAYISLEDTKGIMEVIIFPDLFSKNLFLIQSGKPLVITGTLDKSDDKNIKMKSKQIVLLEDCIKNFKKAVKIKIHCETFKKTELRKLKDILLSVKGPSRVSLEFILNGESRSLDVPHITIDPDKKDILLKHFTAGIDIEVFDEILS
ncbi:MAG: DNA polymerase III subunit alpha [Syntrophorhabdaceae bacterium]|nr:DNA polymerase III subunit alpha [Syntrophorhabdaceae bacterium]MDD5243624.1 DNA polymerase III subunit alpha [Syntrophorhabdaceae bacterium]